MGLGFNGYEIVEYRPEFRDQVLELQTHMWGPNLEKNAAFLEWKYLHNPYIDRPIIYLALHEGQAVGMLGMSGTCWQAGQPSQILYCLQGADAVVHPEHRRRGLLDKMLAASSAGLVGSRYEYTVTLSANQASAAGALKSGWASAGLVQAAHRQARRGQVSSMRRVARQLPLLPSVYRRLRSHINKRFEPSLDQFSLFDAFDKSSAQTRPDKFTHVCVERVPRPKAMAELVDRIGNDGRIRHIRDQQFFAWRFQNPFSTYRFMFWENARLEGYLVLQTPADASDGGWVTIVDWEAASMQARANLLGAAIQRGSFDALSVWSVSLPDEIKALLTGCGFNMLDEQESIRRGVFCNSLLIQTLHPDVPQPEWVFADRRLLDISNWDLRAIYSDNF